MRILLDTTGAIVGYTNSADYAVQPGQSLVPAPAEFEIESAVEWVYQDGALTHDAALALASAKTARIARIKQEAAALIEQSDWQVQRAQEREQAGFANVADVAAVLAVREAVRQSSNAAEAAVNALTDIADVHAFTWQADDVTVPAPRLMTHEQFIQRFTSAEWEAMTGAARANAAMDAWMRRFSLARVVNLDDPATQAGVQALEIAGLLAAGRADEVLG